MYIICMYVYDDHVSTGVCRNQHLFPIYNTTMTTTLTLSSK